MATIVKENYLKNVRNQYEQLPYPPRNPKDDLKKLIVPHADCLDKINFYGFGGKKDFTKNFRVLVAGGGTGDSVIGLGEQFKYIENAEIVYLDISSASMEVAKERAKIRKIDNIKWINDSLLNLPDMNIGKFDYINCSGVLHHLESPEQGLAALKSVLKDDGVICVMLYATYGRMGIYQVQDLMRKINKPEDSINDKLTNCKQVMSSLNENHWFHGIGPVEDIKTYGDSGIYDLLLHEQDRSYTIPELYDFVEDQGLCINHMISGAHDEKGNLTYSPAGYLAESKLLEDVMKFDKRRQQEIAELLNSKIKKHVAYLKKDKVEIPTTEKMEYIPDFSISYIKNYAEKFSKDLENHLGNNFSEMIDKEINVTPSNMPRSTPLKITKNCINILKLMDGHRSIKNILNQIIEDHNSSEDKPSIESLVEEFNALFNSFAKYDWIFLRAPKLPRFTRLPEAIERFDNSLNNI